MATPSITDEDLTRIVDLYESKDRNISATAREWGKTRTTIQKHIRTAIERGLYDANKMHEPNEAVTAQYADVRARKIQLFQKKQRKGTWDKPVVCTIPDGPFRLKLFGDPHLDSDGCDFEQFEKHWLEMNPADRVFGVCIGDFFNNWLRVLSHLWKHEGDPDDAWLLFHQLMNERGAGLIAACSGNHDDWTHAPYDPIDLLMKEHGTIYRRGAVRVILKSGENHVSVALRHKWKGHSQFSPSHALKKAALSGWQDNIMAGGHTHVDEDRMHVDPRTGFKCHMYQLSAFKKYDDFPDVHGFMPHQISPVRDLVIDPRRDNADPEMVKTFFDSENAAAYLDAIR